MGVTDGSDAASGKVGEFLSATNAAVMPISSNGVYTLLGMLTLPAGDWTVGGEIDMWLDTLPTDWVASYVFLGPPPYPTVLDTDVGLDRAWNHEKNPAGIDSQTTTSLGPFRISSSSSTQIAMMAVYYCSQLYTGGADYVIWARRTR